MRDEKKNMDLFAEGRHALSHYVERELTEQMEFILRQIEKTQKQDDLQKDGIRHAMMQGIAAGYSESLKILKAWRDGKVWNSVATSPATEPLSYQGDLR